MGIKVPEPPVPLELLKALYSASPSEVVELVEALPHGDLGVVRFLEAAEVEGWVSARDLEEPQRAIRKVPHQVRVRLISNLLEEWGLVRVVALEAVEAFESRCAPVGDRLLLPVDKWESVASRFFASALSREVFSYVRNHPAAVASVSVRQELLNPWHMLRLRGWVLDLRHLELVPPSLCEYWFTYEVDPGLSEGELRALVERVRRGECDIEQNAVYRLWRSHFAEKDWLYFCDAMGTILAPKRFKLVAIMVGPKSVGKSSLLAAATKPVEPLIASVPLSKLAGERFALQPLIGKWANVYSEQLVPNLKNLDVINSLVGECDWVYVDRKHKPAIRIRSLKSMVFACNALPVITTWSAGAMEAFVDRLSIILVDRPADFQPQKNIADTVPARDSLEFLLWCRRQLEARDWEVEKRGEEELLDMLMQAQSPVYQFVAEACVRDPQAKIERGKLYDAYVEWCASKGITRLLPRADFYAAIRSMGFVERKWKGERYFFGITLFSEAARRGLEEERERWLEGA